MLRGREQESRDRLHREVSPSALRSIRKGWKWLQLEGSMADLSGKQKPLLWKQADTRVFDGV